MISIEYGDNRYSSILQICRAHRNQLSAFTPSLTRPKIAKELGIAAIHDNGAAGYAFHFESEDQLIEFLLRHV